MSELRNRAIQFARNVELSPDAAAGLAQLTEWALKYRPEGDGSRIDPESPLAVVLAQIRIGIDNMVASGFEIGYQSADDDKTPRRALVDRPRKRK